MTTRLAGPASRRVEWAPTPSAPTRTSAAWIRARILRTTRPTSRRATSTATARCGPSPRDSPPTRPGATARWTSSFSTPASSIWPRARSDITPAVPAAAAFPNGAHAEIGPLAAGKTSTAHLGVVLNACLLPSDPSHPGLKLFEYTVKATSADGAEVTREATYRIAVPPPAGPCMGP